MAAVEQRYVEVIVFRRKSNELEFLLLQRAAGEKVYPGMWQIITGKVREQETALAGAFREFREETGFRPKRFWTVPYVNSFYESGSDKIQLLPVFAAEVEENAEPVLSAEHQAYRWMSVSDAGAAIAWPGTRQGVMIVEESIAAGTLASRLLEHDVNNF